MGVGLLVNKVEDGYEVPLSPIIIRTMHRKLIQQGFTCKEACNLLGKLMGLSLSNKEWKLEELIHLWYLEYLDKNHKIKE